MDTSTVVYACNNFLLKRIEGLPSIDKDSTVIVTSQALQSKKIRTYRPKEQDASWTEGLYYYTHETVGAVKTLIILADDMPEADSVEGCLDQLNKTIAETISICKAFTSDLIKNKGKLIFIVPAYKGIEFKWNEISVTIKSFNTLFAEAIRKQSNGKFQVQILEGYTELNETDLTLYQDSSLEMDQSLLDQLNVTLN